MQERQNIEVPHQPRKYHFPEGSFGYKGEDNLSKQHDLILGNG